jgi:TPR repeat protein
MNALELNTTKSAEQIPNSAQGYRKPDVSRPHTSHGQRPPDPQALDGPRIPQQPPLRKDPPRNRGFDQTDLRSDGTVQPSGRPAPNPLQPHNWAAPPNDFQNSVNPQRPYRRRSLTMPENREGGNFQQAVPGPPMPQAYSADPMNSRYEDGSAVPQRNPHLGQTSGSPPIQRFRSHEPPLPFNPPYGGSFTQDMHNTTQESQRHQNRPVYDDRVAPNRGQPDIPNFDAISPIAHKMEEIHLESNTFSPNGYPAHQKVYQASAPSKPHLDTRVPHPDPSSTIQSAPAGFAFELPRNGPQIPPAAGSSSGPAYHDYSEPWAGNDLLAQSTPSQRPDHFQRGISEDARYPPRTASRDNYQPSSANDTRQYPLPNPRGYRPQSPHNTQSGRPNTSHQTSSRNQLDGQASRPNPFAQNDYLQNDPQISTGYQAPFGNSESASTGPKQNFPQQNGISLDQRSKTLNATHPPPVRHYGGRLSLDDQRSSNQSNSYGIHTSPDALPPHPVPVRPGLMNNSNVPQAQPRPNDIKQTQNLQRQAVSEQETKPRQSAEATGPTPSVSVSELNSLQQAVKDHPSDYALALKFAKKLVEAASVLSNDGGKADAKTTAKNRERYIFDAHKAVKKLVSAGYPDAMFYLADCHGQGLLGLAPDPKEAFQLYQSAAKLNHAPSAYRVAVCCEMGQEDGGGTRRDPLKAVQWYKRAAMMGDTPAMYKMGMILLKGLLGQPRNPREALSWLKRAADQADAENPHALHELGLLYESAGPNDHVIRDEKYAFQLFKQAADLGYKYSQFRLGSAFEYGLLGCPIDARQSIGWYTRAATQNEHQSELALSGWYLTGSEGILQQSDTEAYLWARNSASSGLAKAEYAMGYFTEVGIGVPANLEEAKRWYYRAACELLTLCDRTDHH